MSDCIKCGKCCSNYLPLTKAEIKTMKKLAKKENKKAFMMGWHSICPFLNDKNECDIYENRPSICRSYTCEKFETDIFEGEILEKVTKEKFNLVDLRKEIFSGV